jgi:hypothetical protein
MCHALDMGLFIVEKYFAHDVYLSLLSLLPFVCNFDLTYTSTKTKREAYI